MHVLGKLTQYKVSQFISAFLLKKKNMVWFGNLENGVWFVNRKSPVSQLKRVAVMWTDDVSTWTVHNVMADGTIQYDVVASTYMRIQYFPYWKTVVL